MTRVIMVLVVSLIAFLAYSYVSSTSGNFFFGLIAFIVVFAAFFGTLTVIFKPR